MKYDTGQQGWEKKIRWFLTAQTISLLGSSLVQYAIVWYITLTTSSGAMMTISTACGFLPQIGISLFAGVWIDRYDRKKMIMAADSVIALATLMLAVLFLTGHRSVWLLFAVLLVRSAGTGVQTPAVNALIPQIVPRDRLMGINGINSTIQSMMMFLSPALSGLLLSLVTIEATFFVDVATAIVGVGITAAIEIPRIRRDEAETEKRSRPEKRSQLEDIREGFAYLRENPFLKRLLLFQVSVMVLISPSAFLTPLMVSRTFGAEVWRLTVSEMTFSAGAVAGGLLISAWGGFQNRMHTTAVAGGAYGILMIALGAAPAYIIYLAANFLIGVTMPCYNTPITVLIQEKAAAEMHGRVFSFMQIAGACALPLGMMFFGPLADVVAVRHLFLWAGGLVVISTLLALRKL